MSGAENYRSFADPETELELVRSDTPVSEDGLKPGEPTGEIRCPHCGQVAGAPEYIPHLPGCDQDDVKSKYWIETHTGAVVRRRQDVDDERIDVEPVADGGEEE